MKKTLKQIWNIVAMAAIALSTTFCITACGGDDNARLYMNGQLAASGTIKGNIVQGKNPISLGRKQYYTSEGLLDNFTIWSRALTDEEIAAHARTVTLPQATDADCRLLLTFDGTLKDQSQYGNDGVALLDVVLSNNPGITPTGIAVVTPDRDMPAEAVYSIDGRRIGTSAEKLPKRYIHCRWQEIHFPIARSACVDGWSGWSAA